MLPTILWPDLPRIHIKYLHFRPEKLQRFNCSGTIQDFAVAMLCNLNKPVMCDQNAASWGYFDCIQHKWNEELLEKAQFPTHLLPETKRGGEIAGFLEDNWHSIPKGTPIGVFFVFHSLVN